MATTLNNNKGNDWRFLLPLTINQQNANPVSCLKFDGFEDLLWCGSSTGKVTSFASATNYTRYSAFVSTRNGGVNALDVTEDVVYSLSDNCLRGTSRQGVPVTKYSSPSLTKANAICRLPIGSTFIIGGEQQKILQYDFRSEKEIRVSQIDESGAVIIRYNGTSIFTADTSGNIHVRNAKNFETIQKMTCHGDRVSDFDVQGSKLITCGFSQRFKSSHGDPFVKVYDLRMYKAMAPIPLAFAPKFARFMPSYCERIVVVSQNGGVRISDLNSNGIGTSIIVDSNGISAFDFSSTKQFMAFGDYSGGVNIYVDRDEATINENAFETPLSFFPVGPPVSFPIDDTNTPLAAVPMPFPEEDYLLSDWPTELTAPVFRKSVPLLEHVDQKVMHYVTQFKNPRINTKLRFHNVVPYILESEPSPKHMPAKKTIGRARISKLYRKCPQIVSSTTSRKQQAEELRQLFSYNTTRHAGIETSYYMNAILNPIVQLLYHSLPIRNVFFSHICIDEKCIACQIRFLLAMITDRGITAPIVSTDLVRSLLVNGYTTTKNDVIRSTREMLIYITKSVSQITEDLEDGVLSDEERNCLKTELSEILRCVRCGAVQKSQPSTEYSLTLNYGSDRAGSQPTFCQLIEKALHIGSGGASSEERECEECQAKSRMESKRRVKSIAPMLLIDTNSTNEHFGGFWQRQLAVYENRPDEDADEDVDSPTEKKVCRFGEECRNKKTCKFSHGRTDWELENQKLMESGDLEGWTHYVPKRISAQITDGIVRMADISNAPCFEEPNVDVYELVGFVASIGNGEVASRWTHSVTLVRDENESLPWTLINEKLLCKIHENEALHLDARWKLPLLLAYRKRDFKIEDEKRSKIPDSMFYCEDNLASNTQTSSGQAERIELPGKGDIVGIDAEFIKVKCGKLDHERKGLCFTAVGRVSCVNETGTRIIFDDHVVTCTEEVADYLTKFSGIVSDDLDASRSSKYLTTLKRVYMKILVLVQRECIFVGHALHNDFTVLNIHVPSSQIIDTVHLFRLGTERMLALQFLALQLLGDRIQEDSHDSVVDAQYALKIYRKYLELKENGSLNSEMRRIYDIVPCGSPMKSVSPASIISGSQ